MNKTVIMSLYAGFGGRRVSSDATEVSFNATRSALEASSVEDESMKYEKGTYSPDLGWSGLVDSDFGFLQAAEIKADVPSPFFCFAPPGDRGGLAVFQQAHLLGFGPFGGAHGAIATFTANVVGDGDAYLRGHVLYNGMRSNDGVVTASGSTTPVEAGSLGAGQVLGALFVVPDPPGVDGTGVTISMALESDVDALFSTPVTQLTSSTFVQSAPSAGQLLIPNAEIKELDGDSSPITDTFYRVTWTVSGTGPAIYPMAAIAIRNK